MSCSRCASCSEAVQLFFVWRRLRTVPWVQASSMRFHMDDGCFLALTLAAQVFCRLARYGRAGDAAEHGLLHDDGRVATVVANASLKHVWWAPAMHRSTLSGGILLLRV